MDEKGIAMGVSDMVKVLVSQLEAEVFAIEPGNRDWVSLIECVLGNRYRLPPYIIFKGKQIQRA